MMDGFDRMEQLGVGGVLQDIATSTSFNELQHVVFAVFHPQHDDLYSRSNTFNRTRDMHHIHSGHGSINEYYIERQRVFHGEHAVEIECCLTKQDDLFLLVQQSRNNVRKEPIVVHDTYSNRLLHS